MDIMFVMDIMKIMDEDIMKIMDEAILLLLVRSYFPDVYTFEDAWRMAPFMEGSRGAGFHR
jgi:hypothetical protein